MNRSKAKVTMPALLEAAIWWFGALVLTPIFSFWPETADPVDDWGGPREDPGDVAPFPAPMGPAVDREDCAPCRGTGLGVPLPQAGDDLHRIKPPSCPYCGGTGKENTP